MDTAPSPPQWQRAPAVDAEARVPENIAEAPR